MRLQDLAQTSARLAIANDKSSEELRTLLEKWFTKHFVKGIKLPLLKSMHATGAFQAFFGCLTERDEADVIAVLRKLDPHRAELLTRTRAEIEAHIRELAAGRLQPAPKPGSPKKTKTDKGPSGKSARTGGVYERSRL